MRNFWHFPVISSFAQLSLHIFVLGCLSVPIVLFKKWIFGKCIFGKCVLDNVFWKVDFWKMYFWKCIFSGCPDIFDIWSPPELDKLKNDSILGWGRKMNVVPCLVHWQQIEKPKANKAMLHVMLASRHTLFSSLLSSRANLLTQSKINNLPTKMNNFCLKLEISPHGRIFLHRHRL